LPEVQDGKPTGKTMVREFHGNYRGLYDWILEVEKAFPDKTFLPMENASIVNQCGYMFEGSSNRMNYIEDWDSRRA